MAIILFVLLLGVLSPQALGVRPYATGKIVNKQIVQPTLAGYLPVSEDGSALYYAYFEAQSQAEDAGNGPIVLWLQGGPGCASTFGGFYELGPYNVVEDEDGELALEENPGTWNRVFGLLLIDQPVGTGLSYAASNQSTPRDEMGMATHLYTALQLFFTLHSSLRSRPLLITGESYGGKYVPSIAHYILQAASKVGPTDSTTATAREATATALRQPLKYSRALPANVAPPVFKLLGIAIGNGLTDPRSQTQTLAPTAFATGLASSGARDAIAAGAAQVVDLIDKKKWDEAHRVREDLRALITRTTGIATMFDIRRTQDYDPKQAVDRYFNLPDVRQAMRAGRAPNEYVSCSDEVGSAMAADTMQSVAYLLPDVLANVQVLLYQGQFDVLDGPASNTAWIDKLGRWGWSHADELRSANASLWYVRAEQQRDDHGLSGDGKKAAVAAVMVKGSGDGSSSSSGGTSGSSSRARTARRLASQGAARSRGTGSAPVGGSSSSSSGNSRSAIPGVHAGHRIPSARGDKGEAAPVAAGWMRCAGRLTQAVVYRAGHMVPHDQPIAAQHLLERWAQAALDAGNDDGIDCVHI